MKACGGLAGAVAALVMVAGVVSSPVLAADDVASRLDTARTAYQKGDLTRAARDTEAALQMLQDRLGKLFGETLPSLGKGWDGDGVEVASLGDAGGGLSISRAYAKGDASLNASLLLDSAELESTKALLAQPATQPHVKKLKVGAEDALLRFDPATNGGEITMVVAGRVVLEVQGDNITNADILIEAANGWNVAKIKTLLGNEITR